MYVQDYLILVVSRVPSSASRTIGRTTLGHDHRDIFHMNNVRYLCWLAHDHEIYRLPPVGEERDVEERYSK